jgi:hypothetical protein
VVAMKASGDGGTALPIFDVGTTQNRAVCHTPRLLYPHGQLPPRPLDRRLNGPLNCLAENVASP